MSKLSPEESLNLTKLIRESEDFEDNTEQIRKVKHSIKIREDVQLIEDLKRLHYVNGVAPSNFLEICQNKATFLFYHYTDIFNKVVKDELNLDIMYKFLLVLKMIEDGKVNQEEGSVAVGKLLKELYVDSALKRSENLDKQYAKSEEEEEVLKGPVREISWKQWNQKKKDIINSIEKQNK
uniref:Uncharacterized protein n=1 Tax=viral metagenome TaxID=1070528 RepID=A0A6C0HZ36_9ZZZZ